MIQVIDPFVPHDHQLPIIRAFECPEQKQRFFMIAAGRRGGKTVLAQFLLCTYAIEHNKVNTWWVAPVYRQAKMVYRSTKTIYKELIEKKNESELRIEWKSGSITEFKSAENYDNLRGEGLDMVVIDEAAMIRAEAWEEVLRPTLSDRSGRAIFISTPKGMNWFFRLFARGMSADKEDARYISFHYRTQDNPYISPEDIEDAKRTLPAITFSQEYLAEFVDDASSVFRGIDKCIAGTYEHRIPNRSYIAGVDLAKHQDFTVIVVMDIDTRQVVAIERFNQLDWNIQKKRIMLIARHYQAKILLDSTKHDAVLDDLKHAGVKCEGYHFTHQSKVELIQNLMVNIEQQQITFPHDETLLNELRAYSYDISKTGKVTYNAPAGMHDDCVIALALACWGASHHVGLYKDNVIPHKRSVHLSKVLDI